MIHPLDGARLKVVRAQDHLKTLNDEVGRYLDSHPYELIIERDSNKIEANLVIKTAPPPNLSCIIGDCVNSLRASLDYIVWQLGTRYSATPLEVGKDKIYFPFQKDPTLFNADRLAKYSIPAPALSLIEAVQPYQTGYEALGLLPVLTNEDRHRLPLLTLAQIQSSGIRFTDAKGVLFSAVGHAVIKSDRARRAGYLSGASATLKAPTPGIAEQAACDVEVDGQATVFVTFQNATMPREPIDLTLENIVKCVANIVPRFDAFF